MNLRPLSRDAARRGNETQRQRAWPHMLPIQDSVVVCIMILDRCGR